MIRSIAGWIAVVILRGVAKLPIPLVYGIGVSLIPGYVAIRPRQRQRLIRLGRLWSSGTASAFPISYYSMRFRLVLMSLRHHQGRPDSRTHLVENRELYHTALRRGKPVVIVGWHQGPVELLHRIPHADAVALGRVKVLMTARAFSEPLTKFMIRGRSVDGKEIARPGDINALRRWVRSRGVLTVMIDQVPGIPEDYLAIGDGRVSLPWPRRLMEWIASHEVEVLSVAVRLEPRDHIVFRYETFELPENSNFDIERLKKSLSARIDDALHAAPEQYNWSYKKIKIAAAT